MTASRSAGLLLWQADPLRVLLVHPGGPFWARKDAGAWSVPKGEPDPDESDLLAVARREFREELGLAVPDAQAVPLGEVRQRGGKLVSVWAVQADLDLTGFTPGTFEMEWPPRSGQRKSFPEVDRAEWFDLDTAAEKILTSQQPFLDRLRDLAAQHS